MNYIENEEESIIERILNHVMDKYFATVFEFVRHERSLIFLLSLTDPGILKQSKFTDLEITFIKSLAHEKLPRQRALKDSTSLQFLG